MVLKVRSLEFVNYTNKILMAWHLHISLTWESSEQFEVILYVKCGLIFYSRLFISIGIFWFCILSDVLNVVSCHLLI